MKLAIISDVHANAAALEAVLHALPPVDKTVCAGDVIDRFHLNDEVFELLDRYDIDFIQGNHDDGIFHNYMCQKGTLTPRNLSRVLRAPLEREYAFSGNTFLMVHGSPWNRLRGYVYPESPKIQDLAGLGKDVIILGHTHVPMVKRINGVTVINPGSVGQPPVTDPQPRYAIMDTTSGVVRIESIDFHIEEPLLRSVRPEESG
jgi:putative phosphoesterase